MHPLQFYFRCGPNGNGRKWGNMLRIGTGTAKGRRLKTVTGAMRPTGSRVRGSLFDILSVRTVDGTVVDLCAGSGSLGIEALSRGARCCLFIDSDRRAVRMIRDNLVRCEFVGQPGQPGSSDQPGDPVRSGPHSGQFPHDGRLSLEPNPSNEKAKVWMTDAILGLRQLADHACAVDIILADPPYGDPVAQEIVRTVGERNVLAPGGLLVLEHHGDDPLETSPGLDLTRRRNIGDTALSFFQPVPAATVNRSEILPTVLPPPPSRTRR